MCEVELYLKSWNSFGWIRFLPLPVAYLEDSRTPVYIPFGTCLGVFLLFGVLFSLFFFIFCWVSYDRLWWLLFWFLNIRYSFCIISYIDAVVICCVYVNMKML